MYEMRDLNVKPWFAGKGPERAHERFQAVVGKANKRIRPCVHAEIHVDNGEPISHYLGPFGSTLAIAYLAQSLIEEGKHSLCRPSAKGAHHVKPDSIGLNNRIPLHLQAAHVAAITRQDVTCSPT